MRLLEIAACFVVVTASCAEAEPLSSGGLDGGGDVALDTAGLDTSVADDTGAPSDTGTPVDSIVPDVEADTAVADSTTPPLDGSAGCHPVINELQIAGATAGDELVELFNPCASSAPLAGHSLVYRSASGTSDVALVDLSSFTLPAGGYLLFAGAGCTICGAADGTFGGATGALGGAGGGVALKDGAVVVDSVGYGTATNAFVEGTVKAAPATGASIARKPNGADTDDNAADFAEQTPTPRAAN